MENQNLSTFQSLSRKLKLAPYAPHSDMLRFLSQVQQQSIYQSMQKEQGSTQPKNNKPKIRSTLTQKCTTDKSSQSFLRPNCNQAPNWKDQAQESQSKNQQSSKPVQGLKVWSVEDEKKLQELHNAMGNKWVQISMVLQRTENEVKNHYHSRLRKTLRKINRFIYIHLKKDYKPLKMSIISKIIQIAQELFIQSPQKPNQKYKTAFQLKNKIIGVTQLVEKERLTREEHELVVDLVRNLAKFNRNKKKPKRFMRNNYLNLKKTKIYIKKEEIPQEGSNQVEERQPSSKKQRNDNSPFRNNFNYLQQDLRNYPLQTDKQIPIAYINYSSYPQYFTNPYVYTYLPSPLQMYSCQYNFIPPNNQVVKKEENEQDIHFN